MATDYYKLLEVERRATQDEIKRSYRRLARRLHPDANPQDPKAEASFKAVAQAYEVLSDPERRRRYDRFGPERAGAGAGGTADPFGFGGAGGGLGDIFDAFFNQGGSRAGPSGPPRGNDAEVVLDLDFEQAVFGAERQLTVRLAVACDTCEASGAAPGTSAQTCADCKGAGQVRRVRQSILGQMVTAGPCPRCGGLGEIVPQPCTDCRGEGRRTEEKTYTVDIPPGVDTGSTLRLTERGAAGPRGGGPGDLFVHLRVADHDRFERHGYDLVDEIRLSPSQAALGVHLGYHTLDGTEDLVVPAATQPGRVFRLRGRGVPHVEGRGRGDLLVSVEIDVPTGLSEEEEGLLRRLAELRGEDVAPADTGLFSKIRSAFK
ncbi:molecular chaperone DnaJ [soil metagenome]